MLWEHAITINAAVVMPVKKTVAQRVLAMAIRAILAAKALLATLAVKVLLAILAAVDLLANVLAINHLVAMIHAKKAAAVATSMKRCCIIFLKLPIVLGKKYLRKKLKNISVLRKMINSQKLRVLFQKETQNAGSVKWKKRKQCVILRIN